MDRTELKKLQFYIKKTIEKELQLSEKDLNKINNIINDLIDDYYNMQV